MAKVYSSYSSDTETFSIGGTVAANNFTSWSQECPNSLEPLIINKAIPIQDILTSDNFPNDTDITSKAKALTEAYSTYCDCLMSDGMVTTCTAFPPSPAAPSLFVYI